MSAQFEFRLIDGHAPEGELEADHLIAIVQSLKDLAMRVGRTETDAESVGRPPERTRRVANLTIGLAPGSTRLLVRRADDGDALDFDLSEEASFDESFQSLVESIATDERPTWVDDGLASAAGDLRTALERAAPQVEFTVDGQVKRTFRTSDTHRETWTSVDPDAAVQPVTFTGRLRAVNLDTHRLQVTDDVGNKIALPNVPDDEAAGSLLGRYVTVTGIPERNARGQLVQIVESEIEPATSIPGTPGVREVITLDDILASAPGATPGPLAGLTDAETESYLKAIGL